MKVSDLTEQYRSQKRQLNAIRSGNILDENLQALNDTANKVYDGNKLHLFTDNKDVDPLNQQYLKAIKQPLCEFLAVKKGQDILVEDLKKSILALGKPELKVGAKVLFVKNNPDQGYMNCTQGVVVDFYKDAQNQVYPIVETTQKNRIKVYPLSWEMLDEKTK